MLADAQAKADAARQQAYEQAERERRQILERAQQEAERIRRQKVASTQLKARTSAVEDREKLLDRVYQTALQELPTVQQWTDYPEIAQTLLREALSQLRANDSKDQGGPQNHEVFSPMGYWMSYPGK